MLLDIVAARQIKDKVREILLGLPARDRLLLKAVFLDERDRDEVCREFGVDRDYLRVLLHRAKQEFKTEYVKRIGDPDASERLSEKRLKRFAGCAHYLSGWIAREIESMDHSEAVQKMAAERYLLDELTPDEREAFEEHFFDCPECALDLRVGAAFVDEAKVQLPELVAPLPHPAPGEFAKAQKELELLACMVPPGLCRSRVRRACWLSSDIRTWSRIRPFDRRRISPAFFPRCHCRGATRGGSRLSVTSDTKHGVALPIILSQPAGSALYSTYSFELFDPQGKLVWSGSSPAPGDSESDSQPLSLVIPGAMLRNGAYTIVISGIAPQGERTEIDRYVLDLHLTD